MKSYRITEARGRLGALAREASATQQPIGLTDHGQVVAVLMNPAEALELEELRALVQYRAREAAGVIEGIPQEEAYRRIFGDAR